MHPSTHPAGPGAAAMAALDPPPSAISLERRAAPFRETVVRLQPEGRFGLVRWSRHQERGVDFLRLQLRPLDIDVADPAAAMPFPRASDFAPATDTVRVTVQTADGTLLLERPAGLERTPAGRYLLAQAAAWSMANYPDYDHRESRGDGTAPGLAMLAARWEHAAVEEVPPDTLVAELRAATARAGALEARLPALSDERNLLRERIVHLTALCVALGAAAIAGFAGIGL